MLNVDETGHKQNGHRQWTWCFRAELYTLFKIDPTRSGDVLIEVLGTEFDGVLGCDYFSAYRRYHREFGVTLQFCLAHLIRDVKFLTTLPDARDRAYGERLARGVAGALRGDPPPGGPVGAASSRASWRRRGPRCCGCGTHDVPATQAQPQPGEAVRDAWGELFPVHHDPGSGADEQPGGAGDPVRGDRPTDHAGDAERAGKPLVRTDLDGDRDVQSAGAIGVRVSGGGGRGVVRRGRGAVVAAARDLIETRERVGGVRRCKVREDREV